MDWFYRVALLVDEIVSGRYGLACWFLGCQVKRSGTGGEWIAGKKALVVLTY